MSEGTVVTSSELSVAVLQARAGLIAADGSLDIQDQLDLADLCLEYGHTESARLLFEAAFINQGFSRQRLFEHAVIERRTGLWRAAAAASSTATMAAGQATVEIALGELRAFVEATAKGAARCLARRSEAETSPHLTSPAGKTILPSPPADLAAVTHALFMLLSSPKFESDLDLAQQTIAVAQAATAGFAFDLTAVAAAPLPVLAAAVGYNSIQAFLSSNADLALPPLGSAEVLYQAARFDGSGLGPYFCNITNIASNSRDIRELVNAAIETAQAQNVDLGEAYWVGLLTRRLSGPLLEEVVDDLGDADDSAALSMILERAASGSGSQHYLDLVLRVRDAALDNLDYDLASAAQGLVVRLHPDDISERMILGTIDGSAGRRTAAEQCFMTCLALEPEYADALTHLEAVRSDGFQPFSVRQGYGSPKDRQITRLRRRASRGRSD